MTPGAPSLLVAAAAVLSALAVALWPRGGPLGRALALLAALGTLALVLAGPGLLPAGNDGPRLRVLSVLDEATTRGLVEAFEADTGIRCEVDPFAGGTQSVVELLLQQRLQPDVLLGGTSELHQELAAAGLLLPVELRPDPDRLTLHDDPAGLFTPLYLGYLALVHRPLPSLSQHPPGWSSLLDPRWEGRITIPAPDRTGGGLVFLATQLQRQPEEQAWDFLGRLLEQGVSLEPRSSVPISRVASGTADLGVAWAHDILRRRSDDRLPVDLTIPTRTGFEVGAVSVLASTPREAASARFVRFLAGQRAGEIQAARGFRVPLRQDVPPPPYLQQRDLASGERTGFYRPGRVLEQRDPWLARWQRLLEARQAP